MDMGKGPTGLFQAVGAYYADAGHRPVFIGSAYYLPCLKQEFRAYFYKGSW